MKNGTATRKAMSWFWLILGLLYFFIPLISTFLFSLRGKKGVLSFVAYQHVFADPKFLQSFLFSLQMSGYTIIVGLVLIVPTAILLNLKIPKAKPIIELFSLMPFVIPPVYWHLVDKILCQSSSPLFPAPRCSWRICRHFFPYIYRSIDTGLTSNGSESAHRARAKSRRGWLSILFKIILPNLRTALLSATFLTFATVIGELTLAVLLAWPHLVPIGACWKGFGL